MFIVKKLVTPFILPPGIFILLLLTCGTVLLVFKYRKTGLAAVATGWVMWALAIGPVTDVMLTGLTRDLRYNHQIPTGDVIVVLGGGVDARRLDMSGQAGVLGRDMVVRVVTAARLFTRLKVPVIVAGGDPLVQGVAEAVVAARYLTDMGVPARAVIQESTSRDTFENARQVKALCVRHGFKKPILVTSAYHLRRALWCFEKVGLTRLPFANGLTVVEGQAYSWNHFLPGSYEGFSKYLHEYVGLFYYWLVY